jgi:hypothetical protein
MNVTEATLDRGTMFLGSAAIIGWTAGLGVFGALFMLAVWYAMVAESHIPAIICAAFLLSPLALTLVWGVLSWGELAAEKLRLMQHDSALSWWDRRQRHRILYQAYYL